MRAPPDQDIAGVITHPPFIYLAGLALALGFEWLWPTPVLPAPEQYVLGALLFVLGLIATWPAAKAFIRAGTRLPTDRATTALVTTGPYRFTRNPIYIGLTLAYLGVAAAIDSLWAIGALVPILAVMHYGVVLREERYLEGKFGDDYRRYRAAVRRWF